MRSELKTQHVVTPPFGLEGALKQQQRKQQNQPSLPHMLPNISVAASEACASTHMRSHSLAQRLLPAAPASDLGNDTTQNRLNESTSPEYCIGTSALPSVFFRWNATVPVNGVAASNPRRTAASRPRLAATSAALPFAGRPPHAPHTQS
eukprot:3306289-Rhodomonas_salina.1